MAVGYKKNVSALLMHLMLMQGEFHMKGVDSDKGNDAKSIPVTLLRIGTTLRQIKVRQLWNNLGTTAKQNLTACVSRWKVQVMTFVHSTSNPATMSFCNCS